MPWSESLDRFRRWRPWWLIPAVGAMLLLAPSVLGRTVPLPTDLLYAFAPWSDLADAPSDVHNPLLRDLLDVYHPEQQTIWQRLRGPGDAGWIDDAGLGAPGWWFVGTAAMSPFVILSQLVGTYGITVAAVARLTVAGAGVGLAARNWGASRSAATVAAGCFAFSGFMISWLGWPQTHVAAAVGWVWWATSRTADRRRSWWAVPALAVATAASWFGGFPAIAAMLVVSAAGLALGESFAAAGDRWRGVARSAAGLILGTMLAAVQLLPSMAYLDAVDLSARSQAWRGSLPAQLIARWVVPDVYGDGFAVTYWGRINLIEGAAYIGIPALVLVGAAILWRVREPVVARVGVLVAVTGLLVYGFPPLLQLVRITPGLNTNPPARGVVLTCAAMSLLAGFGLDAVRDRACQMTRAGIVWLLGLATGAVLFVAIAQPQRQVYELVADRLTTPQSRAAAVDLAQSGVVIALVTAVVTVALITVVRRGGPGLSRVAVPVLVLITLVDPLVAGAGWNTQRPAEELYPAVESLAALAEAVPPPGRVAAPPGVLLPMTDLRYGYNDARGRRFVTTELRAVIEAAGGAFGSPTRWDLSSDPSAWTPALGALGVHGVVQRPDDPEGRGWPSTDLGGLRLVTVPDATPWISLPSTVVPTPSEEIPGLLAKQHDPDRVLVPPEPPATTDQAEPAHRAQPPQLAAVDVRGRTITARVTVPDGAVLRVLEPNMPGWSATVDGDPSDVVAADSAFIGVVLPPGTTQVRLEWTAPWLATGQAVSLIALMAVGFLMWVSRRRSTG